MRRPVKGVRHRGRGFTLLELIVVMALLAGVMAISAPSLGRFFRTASLKDEGKRVIALTKFARSEAISSGFGQTIWFDRDTGFYGLRESGGFTTAISSNRTYRLNERLRFEVDRSGRDGSNPMTITFFPDGSLSEDSIYGLTIRDPDRDPVGLRIAQRYGRLGYEIRAEQADDIRQVTGESALPASGIHLR